MKWRLCFAMLITLPVFCGQVENLQKSLLFWQDLKAQNGSNYTIESAREFSWHGVRWKTTLKIESDAVVQRSYLIESLDWETDRWIKVDGWTENKDQLGSHEGGLHPMTMEQIYGACEEILNQASDEVVTHLYPENGEGVLDGCFASIPKANDLPSWGYQISDIRFSP